MVFSLTFRVTFSFWRSEPLHLRFGVQRPHLSLFGIQSHYLSSFRRSEPFIIFIQAFRAMFCLVRRLEPLLCLHSVFKAITCLLFGVQSYYLVSFDVQSHYSVRHSMLLSSSFFSFGVQSHYTYPFMHFESPHSFPLLTFRFISPWSYHLGSRSPTFVFIGIAHLILMILAFTLTYLTQSPCAYRLFIIARLDSCSTAHDTVS